MPYFHLDQPERTTTPTELLRNKKSSSDKELTDFKQQRAKKSKSIKKAWNDAWKFESRFIHCNDLFVWSSLLLVLYKSYFTGYYTVDEADYVLIFAISATILFAFAFLLPVFRPKSYSSRNKLIRQLTVTIGALCVFLPYYICGSYLWFILPLVLLFLSFIFDLVIWGCRKGSSFAHKIQSTPVFNSIMALLLICSMLLTFGFTEAKHTVRENAHSMLLDVFSIEVEDTMPYDKYLFAPVGSRTSVYSKYSEDYNTVILTDVLVGLVDSFELGEKFRTTFTVPEVINRPEGGLDKIIHMVKSLFTTSSEPLTVTAIDSYAFMGTSNIQKVVLPKSLTVVWYSAFSYSEIHTIVVNSSFITFKDGFEDCSVSEIVFAPGANTTIDLSQSLREGVRLLVPEEEYQSYCQRNPLYADLFMTYLP